MYISVNMDFSSWPKLHPLFHFRAKRRRIGDDLQASSGKVIKMGNPELTKLWNLNPNNMNACKAEERYNSNYTKSYSS